MMGRRKSGQARLGVATNTIPHSARPVPPAFGQSQGGMLRMESSGGVVRPPRGTQTKRAGGVPPTPGPFRAAQAPQVRLITGQAPLR